MSYIQVKKNQPSPWVYAGFTHEMMVHIQTERDFDRYRLELIAEAVCQVYGISLDYLRGKTRFQPYPDARKVFIKLCRGTLFYKEISCKHLGMYLNKDHSTVVIASQRAVDLYSVDSHFRGKFNKALELSRDRLLLNGYPCKYGRDSIKLTRYGTRDQRLPSLESTDCREGSSYTATTVGELNS